MRHLGKTTTLRVDGLTIRFPRPDGDDIEIVNGLTFTVEPGQLVCIAGRSGSGKTSILRHVTGIADPQPGQVHWDGDDVAQMSASDRADLRRLTAAYLDQDSGLIDELTCLENTLLPAIPSGPRRTRHAARTASTILTDLGLRTRIKARPTTLSGGERQRAVLARALVAATPGIIADEPTASLDRQWADHVIATLRRHADSGGTILTASHDPALAEAADRVIELEH